MSDLILPEKQFVHTHLHSEYSILDGLSKCKEIAQVAKEHGCPAVALTDHGTMAGLVEFYDACREEGIKPILGMEAYITPFGKSRFERERYDIKDMRGKPGHMRNYYHLILLAKSYRGFQSICSMSAASYAEGYYYKPRIDYEVLEANKEDVIVQSACILGEVSHRLYCDDYEGAKEIAMWYKNVFGDDYYLEIMNHELDMEKKIMADIRRLAEELDIKVVATNDSHYPRKEDARLQKTQMLLGMHKSWADNDVSGSFFETDLSNAAQTSDLNDESGESDPIWDMSSELYIKNYDEMVTAMQHGGGENGVAEQELANTLEIAEKCNCELPIIDPECISDYKMPVYDFEKDLQYEAFSKSGYEVPQHTIDAIIEEMHKLPENEGKTYDEMLDEHERLSVRFLMWMCEEGLKKRIIPKIEQKGNPLPMEFWCDNPPEGLRIKHAHNSPDEKWLKAQFESGKTEEDIIQIYRDRLDYEIAVIVAKRFTDYFSIVQQYCNYARLKGSQIGAGRGSGAGSLVNCLLGITSTAADPITNSLLFFRFISLSRKGVPDVDCDFIQSFRENSLKPYLREQYGSDHVSAVATKMVYWGKAAIRAAARALFLPPESVQMSDELCDLIDDAPKLDINTQLDGSNPAFEQKANSTRRHRQIVDLALMLQGRVSGESIHASAFIVAPERITDKLPLSVSKEERKRAQDTGDPIDSYLIQVDGTQTQDKLGYVKLDLLALKDLEVLQKTLESVEKHYGCKIDIEAIPLDDEDVFTMVRDGLNGGIFQLDGSPVALRMVQESGADCIADWGAVSALNRPGPLQMGYDREFINGKLHPDKVTYFTEAAKPILEETYGTVCYQEQVMLLSQEPTIVGFDGGDADTLRKATAKKIPAKVKAICDKAREIAKKNNTDPEITEYFLEVAEASGKYSFNKSHSLAYALVGYRGAFLKCHFPECFLAAMCTIKPQMKKTNKVPGYLEEARQMGVTVKPPHVNYSMEGFDVPEKGVIAFGLGGIKRVGKGAGPIIEEREKNGVFKDFTDFCTRVPKEVGKAPIEALIKAGALDGLGWSRKAMEESVEQIVQFRKDYFKEQEKKSLFVDDLFGDMGNDTSIDTGIELIAPFDTEYSDLAIMRKEREQFGMYFDKDPRDFCQVSRFMMEKKLKAEDKENELMGTEDYARFININEIPNFPDKFRVGFIANVEDLREFNTRKGTRMANMTVWDNGVGEESRFGFSPTKSKVKCTIFSRTLENITKPMPDDVVYVTGRINIDKEGNWPTAIIVDTLDILPPDSQWLSSTSSVSKMQEFAEAQAEMHAYNEEVANPLSKRYLIPALEFKTLVDLECFLTDLRINKYYLREGNVQISTIEDKNNENTRIMNLKQTMGTVKLAAEYGASAKKIRHPKAQRALERKAMMEGTTVEELTEQYESEHTINVTHQ